MILRFVNYLMIAVFILAVLVQYNDVNAFRWMLIYGVACLICILFALKKLHWIAASTVLFISGVWALLKIPDLTASGFQHMLDEVHMTQTGVEAAREFLGLLIIFVWITVLTISSYRKKKGKISPVSE